MAARVPRVEEYMKIRELIFMEFWVKADSVFLAIPGPGSLYATGGVERPPSAQLQAGPGTIENTGLSSEYFKSLPFILFTDTKLLLGFFLW